MSTDLFTHITDFVKLHDPYFEHRKSCVGVLRHNTYQKMTAASRMMVTSQ
jgi:hypothetical protein